MSVGVNKSPRLEYPAGQRQTLEIRTNLLGGRVLTDFSAFTLTVREDPDYPRSDLATADPAGQAWAEVDTDPETEIDPADPDTLLVSFTVPADAGAHRYALDVRGTLAAGGGTVFIHGCTWLSVDVTC